MKLIEHPIITQMERFGYPEPEEIPEFDEDAAYEERRDYERFGRD